MSTIVHFSGPRGERLAGTLWRPASQAGSTKTTPFHPDRHVALLCHGFASHRDGWALPELASELGQIGLTSLRFDYAGNGDSGGEFPGLAGLGTDVRTHMMHCHVNPAL